VRSAYLGLAPDEAEAQYLVVPGLDNEAPGVTHVKAER
jgi:hypothetical protein